MGVPFPTIYQEIQFRTKGDPVLFVDNPEGVSRVQRRRQLDLINWMNAKRFESVGDPEISARISQYEMAFKMQMSVPELTDISTEPESIRNYMVQSLERCHLQIIFWHGDLLKRVRFIQLYDKGWDSGQIVRPYQEQSIDKPIAALLKDLKQRGMLEETLVVWGGEFGRTPMSQGRKDMVEITIPMVLVCGWLEAVSVAAMFMAQLMNLGILPRGSSSCS